MSFVETWCSAMERSDLLRLVLSNVAFDVLKPRLPESVTSTIFDALRTAWNAVRDKQGEESDSLAREALDQALGSIRDELLCRGPEIKPGALPISRVTDHLGVWHYNLDKSAFPSSEQGVPDEAFWILLEEDPVKPSHVRTGSMVRGNRDFAWITTTAAIEAIRVDVGEKRPATHIRNRLGLDHFDVGSVLLELEYPPNTLETTRVAAPTFVEGGTKPVYRSISDETTSWGCAMRLETTTDGAPEAVHTPVLFSANFRIRCLGVVNEEPPPIDIAAYMSKRPRPWQAGDEKLIAAHLHVNEA